MCLPREVWGAGSAELDNVGSSQAPGFVPRVEASVIDRVGLVDQERVIAIKGCGVHVGLPAFAVARAYG